ncbi:hypothetical protein OQI87_01080 [Lactobacillus kefiranofaciens]|uniref:hypothetical protein n=1 Tax=Lactobacillus kefiranofaciens TaxID=267818 RepID=UPI002468E9A0|nr:hypothetical protein [Lactobacillus kefiranofaciens]MDH5099768.1 hypothetical protein [Lactobacillus kefiranofaciens]
MLTNYEQAIVKIHHLEDEYGSITYVPDDNPELKQVQKLLNANEKNDELNYARIESLNRLGYPVNYIAQIINHNKNTINNYLKQKNIKNKRYFRYRVTMPDLSHNIYTTSLIHLADIISHMTSINGKKYATNKLKAQGYIIRTHKFLWYQIPDGDYYCLPYFNNVIPKTGLDSYVYPTA